MPTRFEMTLVRESADGPWRVDYFLPYAPPGIYAEPEYAWTTPDGKRGDAAVSHRRGSVAASSSRVRRRS